MSKPASRRRGRLRQMASGRWQAAYNGPDARVHYCPTGTFANKEYAEGWIASELRLIELDAWTPPAVREAAKWAGRVTVEQYVERWIGSRELRDTTRRTYETTLANHIKGTTIAEVTVKALTRGQVTTWWQSLDKATPRARSKAYSLLRSALNAAVDEELIDTNPARVKNRKAVTTGALRKLVPIEPEQLDQLVAGIQIERYRLLVQLAAWGGLRYGELVALRRRDIDLRGDYPVVSVTRSVTFIPGKEPYAGPPKTDAGERNVVLPSALKPVIAAHLLQHTQPGADGLLFPSKNGGYLWESVFYKAWDKARKAAGLPTLRVHDLRHASAVWALQTGETFSGVQARLGHSTPAAALRYQHAASGSDERIARGLDRRLGVQDQEPIPDQVTPPAEPDAKAPSAS